MKAQNRIASVGLATLLSVGAGAGCKPEGDAAAIRAALPQASSVQIRLPGAGAAASAPVGDKGQGISAAVQAVLGEQAQFYGLTRGVSVELNLGAAYVLILVRTIVAFPVTSVDGDEHTWGPWKEALNPSEYRLRVTPNDQGDYVWALEGRRVADGAGAPFEAVVAGVATPGAAPFRGSGTFTMDFDVAERLDPAGNDGQGKLTVDYDLDAEPKQVVMDYERLEAPPGGAAGLVTFHYEYREAADGGGDFVYRIHGDLDDDGSAWETADVRSRWLASGAGRSDVKIEGGDLGGLTLTGSECWDTSFGRVYWSDSLGWQPTEGDAAACAFPDAASF